MAIFSAFQCQLCSLSMCVLVLCSGLVTKHVLNRKYYVKPSCLKQQPSCLTLSQFSSSNNITSNTTLVFLPGNHFLSSNFTVRNVFLFSMIKSDDTVTINCDETADLRLIMQSLLTFMGWLSLAVKMKMLELLNSTILVPNLKTARLLNLVELISQIKAMSHFWGRTLKKTPRNTVEL